MCAPFNLRRASSAITEVTLRSNTFVIKRRRIDFAEKPDHTHLGKKPTGRLENVPGLRDAPPAANGMMPSTLGSAPSVWCHECRIETEPKAHEWACPLCDGGFIEALEDGIGPEGTGVITVVCVGKDRSADIRYPLACPSTEFVQRVCEQLSIRPGSAVLTLNGDALHTAPELTLAECGLKDGTVLSVSGTWVETAGERGMRLLSELEPRYEDALQCLKQLEGQAHGLSRQQDPDASDPHDSTAEGQQPVARSLHKEALRINELFMRMLETLDGIQTDENRPEIREIRRRHVVNIQERQRELDALTSAIPFV